MAFAKYIYVWYVMYMSTVRREFRCTSGAMEQYPEYSVFEFCVCVCVFSGRSRAVENAAHFRAYEARPFGMRQGVMFTTLGRKVHARSCWLAMAVVMFMLRPPADTFRTPAFHFSGCVCVLWPLYSLCACCAPLCVCVIVPTTLYTTRTG